MLRFFSIGFSQFLLFSAMVLMIFVNIGQLTENMVSRNIYLARLKTPNLANLIGSTSGVPAMSKWGLYNYCNEWNPLTGANVKRQCADHHFIQEFDPISALGANLPQDKISALESRSTTIGNLHEKSKAANYLLFVGTILVGVAFIVTCLIHMSALIVAAFFAFIGFALLLCGAAIWTYMMHRVKNLGLPGLDFDYGNALWLSWASVACSLFAIPALGGGSAASRKRYSSGEVY